MNPHPISFASALFLQLYVSNALDIDSCHISHARRTRCRLPVAVDITASFIEIMLNDAYLNPTEAPRSDNELRLMYAMAVVRLVNGIVDP